MEKINSLANSKVKYLLSLRKASRRKKEDIIIIEGEKEIKMAQLAKLDFVNYYFCPELIKDKKIEESLPRDKTIELSEKVFNKVSYKQNPDGVLVLVKRPQFELEQVQLSKQPLILILEAIEKPGNLGAILRTADAVGVDALILCEASTDIYNPNSIRASLGAIFSVPIATSSNIETMEWLKKNKINIYSAGLEASIDYVEADYKKACAIVIGTEHAGLSEFWLNNSKQNIKIPMQGKIDSLNASVSAAVILYEVLRQRE